MSRGAMGRGVLTAVAATLAVTAVAGGATTASAAWTASGSGASRSAATSVNAGQTPSGVVTGRDVAVSWLASTLASGAAVDGYVVRRYTTAGVVQTVNASCTGVVPGLACTEKGVPSGTWKYTVQPRSGDNWTGAESGFSANVAVGSPTISITSPTTVNTLPATLNGTMANFVDGEVLTFHLDSVGGTTLAGTVGGTATPAAVPSGGSAAVTVTIPTGTPDGSHTIVAVAAPSGDSASAGITVSTPSPTVSVTFPANGATYNAAGWNTACTPVGVCGTAGASGGNTLTAVAVSVRDNATGLCWNGSNFTTAACPNFVAATGTSAWRLALPASALTDGHTYVATARATDDTGHQTTTGGTTFTFDTTAPAVTLARVNGAVVTFPFSTNAAVSTVGGVCTTGDGPVSVTVTGTSSQSGSGTCTAGAWTYTTSPTISAQGTYSFTATQTDAAGNTGSSGARSVTIDTTPPVVTLTQVNGVTVTFPLTTGPAINSVGGACTTGDGPVSVTVTGTSSQSGSATCTAGAWTSTTSPTIATPGTYSFTATQTDAAGNSGSTGAKSVTVAIGPTTSVTFPTNGVYYNGTVWNASQSLCTPTSTQHSICGTNSPTVAPVSAVTVQIQDTSAAGPNNCWNGGSAAAATFNQACDAAHFFAATSTSGTFATWTIPTADAARLTDGHLYKVTVKATDGSGTSTTTSTFGFDTTAPTVTGIVVANTATGGIGAIQPGGGFRVYATATDAGSGIATVTADVHNVTGVAGDAAVAMTLCTSSCTVRGTTYTYVSGVLTSGATTGNHTYTVTATDKTVTALSTTTSNQTAVVDATAPTSTAFAINNRSGGVDGLAEAGDPIVITYSENISVPSLCSNGSFASLPDSATATVTTQAVVKLTDGGAAADTVSVTANDCTLHLGTIGLGTAIGANYISGGAGATFSFSASSIGWNGSTNVLTITLGATTSSTGGGTLVTDLVATTATYTPTSSLTDTAGNAATGTRNSANTRQF